MCVFDRHLKCGNLFHVMWNMLPVLVHLLTHCSFFQTKQHHSSGAGKLCGKTRTRPIWALNECVPSTIIHLDKTIKYTLKGANCIHFGLNEFVISHIHIHSVNRLCCTKAMRWNWFKLNWKFLENHFTSRCCAWNAETVLYYVLPDRNRLKQYYF